MQRILQPGVTARELLNDCVYTRESLDRFLNPVGDNFAQFDPELGYINRASIGRNGSRNDRFPPWHVVYAFEPTGERRREH